MSFERNERQRQFRDSAEKQGRLEMANAIREMVQTLGGRRMLYLFMQQMGVDGSTFNTNAMQQSYNAGKHDAGRWWINAIRAHCPEMEAKIRADGKAWSANIAGMRAIGEQENEH